MTSEVFKPTKVQKKALELLSSGAKHILLFGGSRSGKTTVLVKETDTKELVENNKKKSKTADLVKEADEFAEKNNPIEKVLDKDEEIEIAR